MSLFRHIQKMVEKHQSALLQTFNKKKHAYLSKIQVHRNSFVWRNGFHYSPHPIEQHFMKFKWSFFLITRSDAWRLLNLITSICHFFEWVSSMSFFFHRSVWLCYICLLSRKDIAHFFQCEQNQMCLKTLGLWLFIFCSTPKK